jgi:hypothetical protein
MNMQLTRRRVIISLALVIFAGAIALTVSLWRVRVTILDPRFEVLGVTASRGTNQTVYFGSRAEGQVKDWLIKLGVPVEPTTRVPATLHDSSYVWLWVVYRGNMKKEELAAVQAELTDNLGQVIPLKQGLQEPDSWNPASGRYLGGWIQHLPVTNGQPYRLRLKLPNDGGQLADIQLGAL